MEATRNGRCVLFRDGLQKLLCVLGLDFVKAIECIDQDMRSGQLAVCDRPLLGGLAVCPAGLETVITFLRISR